VARPTPAGIAATRAGQALRRPENWIELAKFCVVGASGYLVNLVVYIALLKGADVHYIPAAACSFVVAVSNNYFWSRQWTFRHRRGHLYHQGMRFFLVSLGGLALNLGILRGLVALGGGKIVGQAVAIACVMPFTFSANKLWSFRR